MNARPSPPGSASGPDASAGSGGSRLKKPETVAVFTHDQPAEPGAGLRRVIAAAARASVEVRLTPLEAEKHGLAAGDGVTIAEDAASVADLAVVLGGDGTMLRALRTFAGRTVPVFAFNFGAIGFLSTVDHGELDGGIERALSGDFEVLGLPALSVELDGHRRLAVNDVSFHRRADERVASLAYSIDAERLGEVRCDGLVASTPVGSTGYNLANGGPVLAWGVEGYVVSFIAPHTLTARALVAATDDPLVVTNLSSRDEVDVMTDGRCVGMVAPGADLEVRFEHDQVLLAQVPGSSFYRRLRQKFGRLAYTGASETGQP